MKTRWARVARGLVTALIATVVAAFSQVVSGGTLPGLAVRRSDSLSDLPTTLF